MDAAIEKTQELSALNQLVRTNFLMHCTEWNIEILIFSYKHGYQAYTYMRLRIYVYIYVYIYGSL